MNDRDELAREVFIADNSGQSREDSLKDWAEYDFASEQSYAHTIADGLIAAGYRKPRTITTVEELDALAMGSKVVSAGYEWTKNYLTINTPSGGIEREVWFNVYDDFDAAADIELPATVLWEPLP